MTLSEAQTHLANASAAYTQALKARAAGHGDKTVARQDVDTLRGEMQHWQRTVDSLTAQANGSTRPGVRIANWA